MAKKPIIDKIRMTVNKKDNKKNYFTLLGNDFDYANTKLKLKVKKHGTGDNWGECGILNKISTQERLVCWVRYPTRKKQVKSRDTETLDITVTNPGAAESVPLVAEVDIADDENNRRQPKRRPRVSADKSVKRKRLK